MRVSCCPGEGVPSRSAICGGCKWRLGGGGGEGSLPLHRLLCEAATGQWDTPDAAVQPCSGNGCAKGFCSNGGGLLQRDQKSHYRSSQIRNVSSPCSVDGDPCPRQRQKLCYIPWVYLDTETLSYCCGTDAASSIEKTKDSAAREAAYIPPPVRTPCPHPLSEAPNRTPLCVVDGLHCRQCSAYHSPPLPESTVQSLGQLLRRCQDYALSRPQVLATAIASLAADPWNATLRYAYVHSIRTLHGGVAPHGLFRGDASAPEGSGWV